MGYAEIIDRRRARREELSTTLRIAHERAQKLLTDPVLTIQEKDFGEVYSSEQIERDIALTKKLKSKWEQEETEQEKNSHKIAEVLEAIILSEGELSEWLGNATTMKASSYDDFVNKVDIIAEWSSPEDGSRVLALGVDVTFGVIKMKEKFLAIRKEIDSGTLGSIQYFKDERGDFMGRRKNVPRAVIGVSHRVVEELAALWNRKDKAALRDHPIQHVILKEIQVQLEAMRDYALRTGKPQIASSFQPALAMVMSLIQEKGPGLYKPLLDDTIFQAILETTKETFRK